MTLHDQLLAVITARLETARAATPGPWERATDNELAADQYPANAIGNWSGEYAWCVSYSGTGIGDAADADARHIASWDPTSAIRVLEALQQVLGRHEEYEGRCMVCMDWCDCPSDALVGDCTCRGNQPWPCREVLSVAAALGVDPTVTGGDE